MKKIIFGLFLVSIILLAMVSGCGNKTQANQNPAAGDATESAAQNIDSDLTSISNLEQDLDTSELDNIDKELAELDNI